MSKIAMEAVVSSFALAIAAVSAPAAAQQANEAAGDIVVTARRIEERLQDVPISISVFNQQQLDNRNVTSGTDLATYTPSLNANSRFGSENASFAIRGFAQESRTTASVGIYFADVDAPRGGSSNIQTGDGAGPGSFFDLQNVQVLKGPQGTLFGRNTTGGAVLLVPRKPTDVFEGYVEGSVGNYDLRRLQAVFNAPLSDTARLRIGVDRQKRDGYAPNVSGIGPEDYSDSDYVALRASLVADLTPDLENYMIVSYSRSETNGQLAQMRGCNPALLTGVLTCQQVGRLAGESKFGVQGTIPNPRSYLQQWQIINTVTWRATDSLTVKNISSYAQLRNAFRADFFGTDWIIPAAVVNPATGARVLGGGLTGRHATFNNSFSPPGGAAARQQGFTNELQLQGGSGDGRLTWQLGAYVELSDPLGNNDNWAATRLVCSDRFSLQCENIPGAPGSLTNQQYRVSYHDYGIYGQATYALSDRLKATAGLRYTWDTSRSRSYNVQYVFGAAGPTGLCANPLVRPRTQPIASPQQCVQTDKQKSDAPTWVLGLDYKPLNDVLLYAKYARGYRQGSVNPIAAGGFNSYNQERVDAYELGLKSSWRGSVPGSLNVSAFYNNLQNQQLALGFTSSPARGSAPPNNAIVNVGKSRLKGIEVEATLGPVAGLRFDGSYAYIDTELLSSTAPTFPESSPYDGYFPLSAGQPAPYTPKNKYTLTGSYEVPVPEGIGRLSVAATYTYVGSQFTQASLFSRLPSYSLINLNVNWRGVGGLPVDVAAFVTNLENKRYELAINDFYTSSGYLSYLNGAPRMYGLRAKYSF